MGYDDDDEDEERQGLQFQPVDFKLPPEVGSGIGREAAMLFTQQGAKVMVVDVNEAALQETCQMARHAFADLADADESQQCHIEYAKCDVSSSEQVYHRHTHFCEKSQICYFFEKVAILKF